MVARVAGGAHEYNYFVEYIKLMFVELYKGYIYFAPLTSTVLTKGNGSLLFDLLGLCRER